MSEETDPYETPQAESKLTKSERPHGCLLAFLTLIILGAELFLVSVFAVPLANSIDETVALFMTLFLHVGVSYGASHLLSTMYFKTPNSFKKSSVGRVIMCFLLPFIGGPVVFIGTFFGACAIMLSGINGL